MTDTDRQIWREAFSLYDNSRTIPDTSEAWQAFVRRLCDFAVRHDWRNSPLAESLAFAVLNALEAECRKRAGEAASRPSQLSFLSEGGAP